MARPLPLLVRWAPIRIARISSSRSATWTRTALTLSYGEESRVAHSHLPSHETLKLVGDTFKNAPSRISIRARCLRASRSTSTSAPAIPTCPCHAALAPTTTSSAGSRARPMSAPPRGGERVDEMSTVCHRDAGCRRRPTAVGMSVLGLPGTVGWKTGYRFIRDKVLSIIPAPHIPTPPTAAWEEYCDKLVDPAGTQRGRVMRAGGDSTRTGGTCSTTRSSRTRWGFPSRQLLSRGTSNPDFHIPITNTGIADFPRRRRAPDARRVHGPTTTCRRSARPFLQASTLVHELGHHDRPPTRRGPDRAELHAAVPQRDELSVPDAWPD